MAVSSALIGCCTFISSCSSGRRRQPLNFLCWVFLAERFHLETSSPADGEWTSCFWTLLIMMMMNQGVNTVIVLLGTPSQWRGRSVPVCTRCPRTWWRSNPRWWWRCLPAWWHAAWRQPEDLPDFDTQRKNLDRIQFSSFSVDNLKN